MILPTNRRLARLPYLKTFLADCPGAVIGWGRKPSGTRAEWIARVLRRPLALLEDGFIRSFERGSPSLSVIVDDIGVYYDARSPSRMEAAIASGTDPAQAARSRKLMQAWRAGAISKYNHAPDYQGELPDDYVLVADQSYGDLSVTTGLGSEDSFAAMLRAALAENPDHDVLVKIHPDVLTHRKLSCFAPKTLKHPRIRLIADGCHPARLLCHAARVYAVTSLIGFEALLWGTPVRCFGMPFYAGWGLTQDEIRAPVRRGKAQIEDVIHAALVAQARYADPEDGSPWQAEQAIAWMARQRAMRFGPPAFAPTLQT
jgi:capsule polysaccharide export protein KpsC/LpsZ